MTNYFTELNNIDCSEHMEKKGKFSYLSWAFAVAALKKKHPQASWIVRRFDNMPYCKTELGYFVEVEVHVEGVAHSQIHPVLDNRNKPIENPTVFEINTSIQRCLVKAIALHGLGLYIYAGEDLPIDAEKPLSEIEQQWIDAIRSGQNKIQEITDAAMRAKIQEHI
jgi:hypothetical protein